MTAEIQQHLHHPDMSLINTDMQRRLPPLVARVQVGAGVGQQLHDGRLVAEGGVMDRPVPVLILDLHVGVETQQHRDHLQVAVLAGRLQGGVAGEDAVHVGADAGARGIALLEHLLAFLGVAVGGRLDQFLVHVAGDVRLEEFLEEGAEAFAAVRVVHGAVLAGHFGHG